MSRLKKYSVGKVHLIRVQSHWTGNQCDTAVYKQCDVDAARAADKARIERLEKAIRWALGEEGEFPGESDTWAVHT
jgi:hypothetical protein